MTHPYRADRPCNLCGKPIKFAKTESGRMMPVSLDSHEKRIVFDGRGGCRVVDTFVSHYADCPQAAAFRKDRA